MRSVLGRYWAKSPGKGKTVGELLTVHLSLARDRARDLRARVGEIPGLPERFWRWVELACLFHDAGKVPDGFQIMIGNPGPKTPWGQRHEVYSLGFVGSLLAELPPDEQAWIALGVVTHHWPISGGKPGRCLEYLDSKRYRTLDGFTTAIGSIDPEVVTELQYWLANECGRSVGAPADVTEITRTAHELFVKVIDDWSDPDDDPSRDLAAVLLQGAITLSDHAASAHEQFILDQPLNDTFRARLTARLEGRFYPHQLQAAAVDGHLLLRAPTGRGKTEGGLLWAVRQVTRLQQECGASPRVFYTLPYLASINAMTRRLAKDLDDPDFELIGVAHSRAASFHLQRAADDDCEDTTDPSDETRARRAVSRAAATRLFREPVRVGTPYQLLRSALAGQAHSGILVDAANSVYLMDELHAYDPSRLGKILAMAGLWTRLGGRVGVLSATFPDRLAELLAKSLDGPLTEVEPPADAVWPARHRLELRTGHLTDPESIEEIAAALRADKSVLVVANNVADALGLYSVLAPAVRERHGDDAALLLHSRFKAEDRAAIEHQILARFEADGSRSPGLLVATQTVEVSLNVDFDLLHTSGAVLEPLIQRFGRANRLGSLPEAAPVIVHQPAYGQRRGGGSEEYADGVYEAEPTRLAWDILERHNGSLLDEKMFGSWLNEIYQSPWGDRWHDDVERHRRQFQESFLSFTMPFDDRQHLADQFDELFDGTEGILLEDEQKYRDALNSAEGAAGRLLAAKYLIPLPPYAVHLASWRKDLGVAIIDGTYTSTDGLTEIRNPGERGYVLGEVL